jgi:hypothetical protein
MYSTYRRVLSRVSRQSLRCTKKFIFFCNVVQYEYELVRSYLLRHDAKALNQSNRIESIYHHLQYSSLYQRTLLTVLASTVEQQ